MADIAPDQSPTYDQAEQADNHGVSDYRTWTFAEDEGGTTEISVSAAHLTVDRSTGPDCDGWSTAVTYTFTQRPADSEWSDGTHVAEAPASRSHVREISVLSDDPREAWHNYVTGELGHYLATRWLTSQPEPLA